MAMSISFEDMNDDIKKYIKSKCSIILPKDNYSDETKIKCFAIDDKNKQVLIPLGLWQELFDIFPNIGPFSVSKISFSRELYIPTTDPKGYRDQKKVASQALKFLKENHVVFLNLATGFGKTTMGVYFHSIIGLKTVVLSFLETVRNQWEACYKANSDAKVQQVKGKGKKDPKADVYIIGSEKASTMDSEFFIDVGLLIIDEAHMAPELLFSKTIMKFQPKYVIGLSATPDVKLANGVINLYFSSNFIIERERKNFTVIKYRTNFKPNIEYIKVKGRMVPNWTELINSLAYNSERWQLIVKEIILPNKDKNVMILSDRNDECQGIYDTLIFEGINEEEMCLYVGTVRSWNKNCKILIASSRKAGVGFDDNEWFKVLVLLCESKDVRQREGRLRANNSVIYDLVDNYSTLEKHFNERKKWYLSKGAKILEQGYKEEFKPFTEHSLRLLPRNE